MPQTNAASRRVYLDYNATTPVDREVLEAMLPYFSDAAGNASSIHSAGRRARSAVENARASVAQLIGAKPSEIVFTSGGTEADNLAIFGCIGASNRERKHIICSAIEHHAVLEACEAAAKRGAEITWLPVSSGGIVDPEFVRRAIRPDTILITVMHANNELGTIQPVEDIGTIVRESKVRFHTDAVQSVGKIPVDVKAIGADLLSLSAHKICGPKGVGVLYVREGTPLEPMLRGGSNQRDRRPGTENVPGIVGLGKAAEIARRELAAGHSHLASLRDRLEQGILRSVPGTRVNGDRARRVPNTTNISFAECEGESLVIGLDLGGVECATGAACSSGAVSPSHVLTAIGLSPAEAKSSLRLSLGRFSTVEDVDTALGVIPSVVNRVRSVAAARVKPVAAL
ncbi:MAG TPA: cysteine desulfurase family protein [Candidatus Acidoferrales bacterium]|nr:cysteine desulfurase family protein [Candidatus Acidoferrales bacterium]